ncbi:thioesterase [Streptomyces variabilis]|uniref:Thioesterase n=1 Tax=Streptomyces variabilis TaxID=67372 RepID=A0ABQ2U8U7_9ACTN|nr:thioesterase domain-containing protein [Streptomyces variabilis]MQL62989.1 thioesterase [Streptomyces vinaceus]GGP31316.1 thioesterase [Streptomyces griseoincarnatus]GGT74920.1 thioesterase [Streptomyces variabilis]
MDSTPPALRLFVLHHAGGSHVLYRHWPAGLPDTWDVRLLDAPGHGFLLDQPQIADAGLLADFLLRQIEPELNRPYALFGHSMGALLAYEITRRAVGRGLPWPVWVGVSARPAPQLVVPGRRYHALPGGELRDRLKDLGGTPDSVFDDPGLWDLFEPVIRGDLRLVETWRHTAGAGPLPVALSAYAGAEDRHASPARMAGWDEHSEHFLGLRSFDGGHFYFQDDPRPLLRRIEQDATTALDAVTVTRSS